MTTTEAIAQFHVPRQTLQRWRHETRFTKTVNGKPKSYTYKAKLKKGIHWKFNADGKIIYTPSGVAVIRQLTKGKTK